MEINSNDITGEIDILALDANCIVYWCYNEIKTKNPHLDKASDIINEITSEFTKVLKIICEALNPKVLLIVLDGVPSLAKIIDQRKRRIGKSDKDYLDSNGNILFTTSWICPYSYIMESIDKELREIDGLSFCGTIATIYSGPGTAGEGEHKIFPMLQNLVRVNDILKNQESINICIFGNDNDLFLLSILFLATFKKNKPKVYLYDDAKSRDSTTDSPYPSFDGFKFFDIDLLLNVITSKTGHFSAPGNTSIEKVIHFIHLSSLLGNDFLPSMYQGDIIPFWKSVLKGAKKTNSNGNYLHKFPEFPISASEDNSDELPSITMMGPYLNYTALFLNINSAVNENQEPNLNADKDRLLALSMANCIDPKQSNELAFCAAVDYIRMMDNVLTYYLNSCCILPMKLTDYHKYTMPAEYYGYHMPPPSLNYLIAGAQILSAFQSGDMGKYPRSLMALDTFSISSIKYDKHPEPAPFEDPKFHAIMLLTGKSLINENTALHPGIPTLLSEKDLKIFGILYVTDLKDEINPCILPKFFIDTIRTIYSHDKNLDITNEIKISIAKPDKEASTSNYVADSLEPSSLS